MSATDETLAQFRTSLPDYESLTAQLQSWAESHPGLFQLSSLGTTPEGREIWLAEVGDSSLDPGRPAVWVDANMHAAELVGTSVCLGIIEELLRIHRGEGSGAAPAAVADALREVRVMVVPRVSPDGAEAVLKTGRYVRSVPRDERANREHARWVSEDMDGDGLMLVMRVLDPTGEFVESPNVAGLMVPREIHDEGPFYKIYPEGTIENFDGSTIPEPGMLADQDPDLNRNFPYHWAPEPKQLGAGRYPLSEMESRVIAEKVTETPNLFAWMNLHTFGGVHIRPLGNGSDATMDPRERAIWADFEAWATDCTGYPTVSGFEQFTYQEGTPLHGDLVDFAYRTRGCLAWACEVWDIFEQVGLPKQKRFVDRYSKLEREHFEAIAAWDKEHNQGRVMRPWKKVEHPQLGDVEVGGVDPRFGLWNPPFEVMDDHIKGLTALFCRVAAMVPRVRVSAEVRELSPGLNEVNVLIENQGYFPTYGMPTAKALSWNEPLYLSVEAEEGCELGNEHDSHTEIGHLEGWARGRHAGGALYYQRSQGSVSRTTRRIVVKGHGRVCIEVRSCRVGKTGLRVEVGSGSA